jgi:hypothetical protein
MCKQTYWGVGPGWLITALTVKEPPSEFSLLTVLQHHYEILVVGRLNLAKVIKPDCDFRVGISINGFENVREVLPLTSAAPSKALLAWSRLSW